MYTYTIATNNYLEDVDPIGCHVQVGANVVPAGMASYTVLGRPFFNGFNAEFDLAERAVGFAQAVNSFSYVY